MKKHKKLYTHRIKRMNMILKKNFHVGFLIIIFRQNNTTLVKKGDSYHQKGTAPYFLLMLFP